jgi:signal transduction histidine kinase
VRRVEGVATVAAALSRAASSALDPTSVLQRTLEVLMPELPVVEAHLWRAGDEGPTLLASHPAPEAESAAPAPPSPEPADPSGSLTMPVRSRGHLLAHLVVHVVPGERLDEEDQALLEIAADQVGGALERLDLFREVMELERMKSDFIARVSHELRTPITIISGFLETLLAHDAVLEADRRVHMLERSRVAAARLGHLIEELLILSRIEGGVLTPRLGEVDLASAFEEVRATASEPDQVLVLGEPAGTLVTDEALLVQALGLVVDNAVKYGGVAELSAQHGDQGWVLQVRDRGPGFGEDIRGTAFEMFARSQSVSMVPGLGAGLAIARTIVEVLDGTIVLGDAHPGPGAIVTITLRG